MLTKSEIRETRSKIKAFELEMYRNIASCRDRLTYLASVCAHDWMEETLPNSHYVKRTCNDCGAVIVVSNQKVA
jgi:hypothetical protein